MTRFRHAFEILHHSDEAHPWRERQASGPFSMLAEAQAALHAHLAAGGTGTITEYWSGFCTRCKEHITVPARYWQHGCGEIYDYDPTF